MEDLDHCKLTDSCFLGIMTGNACSKYLITQELQSTLDASGIETPAMRNHILWMAHCTQLAWGTFMCSHSSNGCKEAWEAHECNPKFGHNARPAIVKSQRLWKDGNARINKVSAMRPGLAKIIGKVHISRHFESPETDLHIAEDAWWIDYAESWWSRRVHWLSKSQSTKRSSTYYGYGHIGEFNIRVASASIPITRIHLHGAQKSKIQWLPATHHNTGSMDHREVSDGCFMAIPILDSVDVQKAYRHSTSCHHWLEWHVPSYRCHYASSN